MSDKALKRNEWEARFPLHISRLGKELSASRHIIYRSNGTEVGKCEHNKATGETIFTILSHEEAAMILEHYKRGIVR